MATIALRDSGNGKNYDLQFLWDEKAYKQSEFEKSLGSSILKVTYAKFSSSDLETTIVSFFPREHSGDPITLETKGFNGTLPMPISAPCNSSDVFVTYCLEYNDEKTSSIKMKPIESLLIKVKKKGQEFGEWPKKVPAIALLDVDEYLRQYAEELNKGKKKNKQVKYFPDEKGPFMKCQICCTKNLSNQGVRVFAKTLFWNTGSGKYDLFAKTQKVLKDNIQAQHALLVKLGNDEAGYDPKTQKKQIEEAQRKFKIVEVFRDALKVFVENPTAKIKLHIRFQKEYPGHGPVVLFSAGMPD